MWSIINHIQVTISPSTNWYWLWLIGDFSVPLQGKAVYALLVTCIGFLNFLVYASTNEILPISPIINFFHRFSPLRHRTDTAEEDAMVFSEFSPAPPIARSSLPDLASRIVYDYEP